MWRTEVYGFRENVRLRSRFCVERLERGGVNGVCARACLCRALPLVCAHAFVSVPCTLALWLRSRR